MILWTLKPDKSIVILLAILATGLSCLVLPSLKPVETPLQPSPTFTLQLRPISTTIPASATAASSLSTSILTPSPRLSETPEPSFAVELPLPVGTPKESWQTLLVMPGAFAGEEKEGAYWFAIYETPSRVRQFYETAMPPVGWYLLAAGEGDQGGYLLIFQKDEKTATVSIIPQGVVTIVMLVKP